MLDDYKNIYLYHGSDSIVDNPDLNKCRDGKDFGKGFYLTKDKKQAQKFAKLVSKKNSTSKAYLNIYYLEELKGNAICFEGCDLAWLYCVLGNRDKRIKKYIKEFDKFEIIAGKIADDDTSRTINAYLIGAYGQVGSEEAIKQTIKMFKPNKLNDQICFKSKRSLKLLRYIKTVEVR